MQRFLWMVLVAPMAQGAQIERTTLAKFLTSPPAQQVQLHGLVGARGPVTLRLERFDPIAADARFVVVEKAGEREVERPDSRFYRGKALGAGSGEAFLAIHSDGSYHGIVQDGNGTSVIAPDGDRFALKLIEDAASPFECAVHDHARMQSPLTTAELPTFAARFPEGVQYNARVAIDTDQEYLARFGGNTTNATNYLTTLIAYMSTLYTTGVDTQMQLSFSRLWTTTDPWVQTDTGCMLLEVGKHWNDNMGAEVRALMHFVSGKNSLSGIAWVGEVCSGPFPTSPAALGLTCPGMTGSSNYGGAYGVTSGVSGSFNPGNPVVVWDSLALAHEIGHNFNSKHTHCYGGIGGIANPPIDTCSNLEAGQTGCHSGTQSLPGLAGQGSGTIMSYCHLLSPGLSNITMTFGQGHGFGVLPGRVNDVMRAEAQANAACLALPANPNIFANGFE